MRITRYILLALVLMLAANTAGAQQLTREVDSLISTASMLPDSLKAARYNKISYRSRYQWPLIALQNSQQAIKWATETNNYVELSKAYSFAGLVERNIENYNEALRYYDLSLKTCERCNDSLQLAHTYNNIGNLYIFLGEYDKAAQNLDTALKLGQKINSMDVIGYVWANYGTLYTKLERYNEAVSALWKCAEARKGDGFSKNSKMQVQYSLVDIYMETNELDSAKKYLYNFHRVYVDTMYTWLSDSWRKLAIVYEREGNTDSAFYCGIKALETAEQTHDYSFVMSANHVLNNVIMNRKLYNMAANSLYEQVSMQDQIYAEDVAKHKKYLEFSSEYLAKQSEIDKMSAQSRYNTILITVICLLLAAGLIMAAWMLKNYMRIRSLNAELTEQKNEIDNNILIAQNIQKSILPDMDSWGNCFDDKFLLFKPRDGVSGDFYWKYEDSQYEILAVADCTGHGVPGASMSMIGAAALQDIVSHHERDAAQILEKLRSRIKTLLHQNYKEQKIQDGIEMGIVVIDKQTMIMEYAGAYNPLTYIRNGKLFVMKAVKCPVGIYISEKPFTSEKLQLQKGDCIYMMSDGYTSQFGGSDNKKISKNDMMDLLLKNHHKPMDEQKACLDNYFENWRGDGLQIDDVLVAGFRV